MQTPFDPPPLDTGAASGPELAAALSRRHPNDDWLAALAKGAVMNRGDVEEILRSDAPPPQQIIDAVTALETVLRPPDPEARDDVFEAQTNAQDAVMEVDGEAGLQTVASPKPHPSRSNSPDEQGVREGDYQNNEI